MPVLLLEKIRCLTNFEIKLKNPANILDSQIHDTYKKADIFILKIFRWVKNCFQSNLFIVKLLHKIDSIFENLLPYVKFPHGVQKVERFLFVDLLSVEIW